MGIFSYISPIYGLFFLCIIVIFKILIIYLWMLYLSLLRYVGALHTIFYLVALHLGNLVMRIYCIWFFIPFTPSSLTWIQKSWINISLFELLVKCIETHICVPSFLISHVFISILKFFCFLLLLWQLLTLNIRHSNTCNQHHLYTIFDKIPSFSCFVFSHTCL